MRRMNHILLEDQSMKEKLLFPNALTAGLAMGGLFEPVSEDPDPKADPRAPVFLRDGYHTCPICSRKLRTRSAFDVHMDERHPVDEPA